jgi:hypothetical protein
VIPTKINFELSETIGLTGWGEPDLESDPVRFVRYRRFTTAVAIALVHAGIDTDIFRAPNYLARDLLIDRDRENPNYLSLLQKILLVTRGVLIVQNDDTEYPFFTFASMILAQSINDFASADQLALQLLRDESNVRANQAVSFLIEDDRFLFGLSNYDQVDHDWQQFAIELTNPNGDENTQLVCDSLTRFRPSD